MNDRIKFTENEKMAMTECSNADRVLFMGNNDNIDTLIQKEKTRKFNSEVEQFSNDMEKRNSEVQETQESLKYDINKAEIKPLFSRVLIKPFSQNPFQKMKVENGLIIDAGGYTPHQQINPMTGKYEEQKEFIVTGCVAEIGPDCKYVAVGDVVYYRRDTVVPVPFFKSGLVSLAENQIIACVNEGLTNRFSTKLIPDCID